MEGPLGSRTQRIRIDPRELAGPVTFSMDEVAQCNIFCMFALTQPRPEPLMNSENNGLGTAFVLILNTQDFLARVSAAAKMAGLSGRGGPVRYFDENEYSGPTGPFLKSSRFSTQCEYRLVVRPGMEPYRELMLGSLDDITSPVLPLAEIDNIVDFSPERAIEAGLSYQG